MTINDLCEQGQRLLIDTQYLEAIDVLLQAESLAMTSNDFDAISRLYMPLQEARRQVRQRCGEGIVRFDVLSDGGRDPEPVELLSRYFSGQFLIAGLGSCASAVQFRAMARESKRYVETFLGAVFPMIGGASAVVVVPTADVALPPPTPQSIDALLAALPPHARVFGLGELPAGEQRGTAATFDAVSDIWESLHLPFLAAADQERDPLRKIAAYRKTIEVDYACELAHQRLSAAAREVSRTQRAV